MSFENFAKEILRKFGNTNPNITIGKNMIGQGCNQMGNISNNCIHKYMYFYSSILNDVQLLDVLQKETVLRFKVEIQGYLNLQPCQGVRKIQREQKDNLSSLLSKFYTLNSIINPETKVFESERFKVSTSQQGYGGDFSAIVYSLVLFTVFLKNKLGSN